MPGHAKKAAPAKSQTTRPAAAAKQATPGGGGGAAAKSDVKGMGFAAASAHLAPGGGAERKVAPPPSPDMADGPMAMAARKKGESAELSPAEVQSAVRYNKARGFPVATIKKFQRIVGTEADGQFGPNTVRQIAQFQARHRLEVDGKIGPMTQNRLNAESAQDQPNKQPAPTRPGGGGGQKQPVRLNHADVLEAIDYNKGKGFSVAQVKKIQTRVGAGVDGQMGPETVRKIADFQARNGLEVDGKVGPATARAIGVELANPNNAQGSNAQKLQAGMNRARAMGLTITSTTGGKHTPGSFHYQGRAFDAAGAAKTMKAFFWEMLKTRPTELFHDPCGAFDNGVYSKQGIGGHSRHVHVAY